MDPFEKEGWVNFFRTIEGKTASILVNLNYSADALRPWLLCIRLALNLPRPDGLTTSEEFPTLKDLEDALTPWAENRASAKYIGRITGSSRRLFYFYLPANDSAIVCKPLGRFHEYKYEVEITHDPKWDFYTNLCPNDEEMQAVKNGRVLEALEEHGDSLESERDVRHWIYFRTKDDRTSFLKEAGELGFKKEFDCDGKSLRPYGLCVSRIDSVEYASINETILTLFRMAKTLDAEYDGWETEVVAKPN